MGLSKDIFKHAAIYSIATVTGRLISFVMLPFYANIFHAEGYGVIGLIDATLGMLTIMFAGGAHASILRIYHEESEEKKGLVISTATRLVFGIALVALLVPMVFSAQLSRVLLGGDQFSVCFLLAMITFLIDVGGQSASVSMIINQQSILYSVVNLVRLVVGLFLNIWLVLILEVGLVGIFITSLVTAVCASGAFLVVALKEHGIGYDKQIASRLLRLHLPLLPGDVISFISRQSEVYLVRFIIDLRSVGILEMAYKFPPLLNLFIAIPFSRAWRSKAIEIAEYDQHAPRIIAQMFTKCFFMMVFGGIVLAVSIQDLLKIMTPPEFWEAGHIARIEIITTIVACVNSLFIFGLQYRKRTGIISAVRIAMAILKVPLAFFMIVSFHLAGAAYSGLIIESIMSVAFLNQSQKHYRIDYEYPKLLIIASYGLLIYFVIVNNTVSQLFDLASMRQLVTELVTGVVGYVPLTGGGSEKVLKIVMDRQDSVFALIINICCSAMFLIAVPLLAHDRQLGAERKIAEEST
jgi:O-antigen/teichoic acid export membrane protein